LAGVTVGERILVHLSGFLKYGDAYECPIEMTQDGIAAALLLSRAHVALELKRLKTTTRVEERMAHVANARSRRKVYALTPSGQEIARRMRDHAKGRALRLAGPDGLRDVSGAEAIEALRHAGLRESEAVQRALATDVIELPRPEASRAAPPARAFFGRADERRILRDWLASDSNATAVMIGVAGVGKSALIARLLESETRPTMVRKVYAHDDAHGLLSSLADFLARQGRRRLKALITRPAYNPTEAAAVLRTDLAGCVLALDDLHACAAADALLRSVLEAPTSGKLLVTSRTQPTFYEESDLLSFRVIEVTLDGLDDAASEDLLASRGAALGPDEVRHVISATRGHPLALELFAASGLGAGAVATERYILETVLDGLDDASEGLLRTFAVLRRPARSPEALGATVSQLRRLAKQALLQHREEGYLIHDLVKEFFLQRMAEVPRREAHARAAAYWATRGDGLEEVHHRIEAGDLTAAAARLAEVGPAFAESARAGDLESALLQVPRDAGLDRILVETEMFLGKFDAARAILERVVASGGPEDRVRARTHLGRIENRLGAYREARATLDSAVHEAIRLGSREVQGEALRALGGVERKLGDLDAAIRHLREAAGTLPDGRERTRTLTDLGAALIARGDIPGAKAALLEAASAVRRATREDAVIQNNLGIVQSKEGDPATAATTFARSADIALATGEIRFAAYALANAVDNFLRMGAIETAGRNAERALALANTIGDPLAVSTARANLGLVFARRGEWAKAEEHLLGSIDVINRLDNPYSLATRCQEIAGLYEAQGRGGDADSWRSRAEGLFARLQGSGTSRPLTP
jgi:tetratricopeptide (TPR) repeat protein/DNA-binding MarR family transcriptional regulator